MPKVILRNLETGEIVHKELPFDFILNNQAASGHIVIDGTEYKRLVYMEVGEQKLDRIQKFGGPKYPYFSDAMGVHPKQIEEAKRKLAALGVRVEYTRDGRAIIESPEHRKRLAEAMGLHDRNSWGTSKEARHRPYRVI
ncbi:MAG: hypothetical protein KatS3mg087_1022 [Patescibacteria group bacterium]|nr:MAG: hypothetical protein KatS3mg087_1022 [Patescibacteria group bacterium]